MLCTPHQTPTYASDHIKKNESRSSGGEERSIQGFDRETWGRETTWKKQASLKWIFKKCDDEAWTGLIWFRI